MLIISSRSDFSDPDKLKNLGHEFREINFIDDSVKTAFKDQLSFVKHLKGKKILMLVHGYSSEQDEVYDAYAVIENKIEQHIESEYDYIIGYIWPGGNERWEWLSAKQRANAVARRFRFLIESLSDVTSSIDIMSHSLGARVVLKALKEAEDRRIIRNYYCMAAAVDNEVFEKDKEFSRSVSKAEAIFVFHSDKDRVLSFAYRVVEFDRALGLSGPEDRAYIQNKTKNIYALNCKHEVSAHGEYKHSDPVYQYIAKSLVKKPAKFKTLY